MQSSTAYRCVHILEESHNVCSCVDIWNYHFRSGLSGCRAASMIPQIHTYGCRSIMFSWSLSLSRRVHLHKNTQFQCTLSLHFWSYFYLFSVSVDRFCVVMRYLNAKMTKQSLFVWSELKWVCEVRETKISKKMWRVWHTNTHKYISVYFSWWRRLLFLFLLSTKYGCVLSCRSSLCSICTHCCCAFYLFRRSFVCVCHLIVEHT